MMGGEGGSANVAVDMRHSKLKREEVELLSGELKKPSWQSKNEGIHERVSFEDTIWGFDLAGGAYYQTPLRVVGVRPGSRAEKAGIRLGDKLKRINDIDTSTLTIQEAHKIILASGVHLKLAVTAPEDEEDAYFCYEDPLEVPFDEEAARLEEEERARKRQVHAKVSSYWSLQWPWVSKRKIIYRESNCFMVPSKYESTHSGKFSPQPKIRTQDNVVLDTISSKNRNSNGINISNRSNEKVKNGNADENHVLTNGVTEKKNFEPTNKNIKQIGINSLGEIPEEGSILSDLEDSKEDNSVVENSVDDVSSIVEDSHDALSPSNEMLDSSEILTRSAESENLKNEKAIHNNNLNSTQQQNEETTNGELAKSEEIMNTNDDVDVSQSDVVIISDDEVLNEIIKNGNIVAEEEILNSVLSGVEENSDVNSVSIS